MQHIAKDPRYQIRVRGVLGDMRLIYAKLEVHKHGPRLRRRNSRALDQTIRRVDYSGPRRQAFFAAAMHDLRSPLTSLTLWIDGLQLIKPRLEACGDEQATLLLDQALEQMQQLVQHSLHLVEHALDVTKLEAGRPLAFSPREVDLVRLARQVLCERPRQNTRLVRLESAQPGVWGWWDADRLARVLENHQRDQVQSRVPTGDRPSGAGHRRRTALGKF
jgi:signal transduction histidine kinase